MISQFFCISVNVFLGMEVLEGIITSHKHVPILGLYENRSQPLSGRIAVYGNSNCLDSSHMSKNCFWMLDALLEFTMHGQVRCYLLLL